MSDITWHTDMENIPNSVPLLLKYNDGSFKCESALENDTDWKRYYPMEASTVKGVATPIGYVLLEPE